MRLSIKPACYPSESFNVVRFSIGLLFFVARTAGTKHLSRYRSCIDQKRADTSTTTANPVSSVSWNANLPSKWKPFRELRGKKNKNTMQRPPLTLRFSLSRRVNRSRIIGYQIMLSNITQWFTRRFALPPPTLLRFSAYPFGVFCGFPKNRGCEGRHDIGIESTRRDKHPATTLEPSMSGTLREGNGRSIGLTRWHKPSTALQALHRPKES
jgi:hypothetical protein